MEPQFYNHRELNLAKNLNELATGSSLDSPVRNTVQSTLISGAYIEYPASHTDNNFGYLRLLSL